MWFLGMSAMKSSKNIDDEYDLDLIHHRPTVIYEIKTQWRIIKSITIKMPDRLIDEFREPIARCHILNAA